MTNPTANMEQILNRLRTISEWCVPTVITTARTILAVTLATACCSCQSVSPSLERTALRSAPVDTSRVAAVTDPAATSQAVTGQAAVGPAVNRSPLTRLAGRPNSRHAARVTDAAELPSPAATPQTPEPSIALVAHAGPFSSEASGFGHPPNSALGTSACSCGRAPQGLCACAHGSFDQRIFAADEYLCNGGDSETNVLVKSDWSVHGLHAGDTVAHFDTTDGQLKVVHSNELCIYAPRFAAVRHVSGLIQHEQHQRGAGVERAGGLREHFEHQIATTVLQPLQPKRHLSVANSQRLQDSARVLRLESQQSVAGTTGGLLPFEDFAIVRHGQFDNAEKVRLAKRSQAAVTWTHELGPQVVIDNRTAVESSGDTASQAVYRFELPTGKPIVRIVKVASTEQAQPGDFVDFTIRFDNIGDQVVGNVTVIDRLITRLEYVADSQSSTVAADFFTQENDGESLTLRWELTEPLPVGEGGVIRFQCRVR